MNNELGQLARLKFERLPPSRSFPVLRFVIAMLLARDGTPVGA
jgi:hypothetical protein